MPDGSARARALAERMGGAAEALLSEVSRLPADLVPWKPAPDVWSVMEILCHVTEFVPYWIAQAVQVARHPEEPWGRTHADEARRAAVARAGERAPGEVVDDIRARVRSATSTLAGLAEADLDAEATSRNPRWARKPASFIVEHLLIEHLESHAGQIRRNVMQFRERRGGR